MTTMLYSPVHKTRIEFGNVEEKTWPKEIPATIKLNLAGIQI